MYSLEGKRSKEVHSTSLKVDLRKIVFGSGDCSLFNNLFIICIYNSVLFVFIRYVIFVIIYNADNL
jgi:hypothetical protein